MISRDDDTAAQERMEQMTRWWWHMVHKLPGISPEGAVTMATAMMEKEHDLTWAVLMEHQHMPWEDDDG